MNSLPYKLSTTNDQLTSRAGLLTVALMIEQLGLSKLLDQAFPEPKSNRAISAASYFETLILMQHQGLFHLDDVKHLHQDQALSQVLGIDCIPKASALGNWLRRMGKSQLGLQALQKVNQHLLKTALHKRKGVTLDIDATEITSQKAEAKWTYNKNLGYMPMVAHIAEVGMVVACDFREGNQPPAKDNLAFIEQCQSALPYGCFVQNLRIDAAGYQVKIIQSCEQHDIYYAIRAKMSAAIKEQIEVFNDKDWQPLIYKNGEQSSSQSTCRIIHWMTDHETPLNLVIQRKALKGQSELALNEATADKTEITHQGYLYRAIVCNRENWTDSQIIHWYNQRGEDSENRIKELKLDFGGNVLPCSDFDANALYFMICAMSFNLFALMRLLLPEALSHHRVVTLRWKVYFMPAKVVRTSRQILIKMTRKNQQLLEAILERIRTIEYQTA